MKKILLITLLSSTFLLGSCGNPNTNTTTFDETTTQEETTLVTTAKELTQLEEDIFEIIDIYVSKKGSSAITQGYDFGAIPAFFTNSAFYHLDRLVESTDTEALVQSVESFDELKQAVTYDENWNEVPLFDDNGVAVMVDSKSAGDYFKLISNLLVEGIENPGELTNAQNKTLTKALLDKKDSIVNDMYNGYSAHYALLSVDMLGLESTEANNFREAMITILTNQGTKAKDMGVDIGAAQIIALSKYSDTPKVKAVIDEYVDYVKSLLNDKAGIEYVDFSNQTVENSCSNSMVILGLIANGIDPTSSDFTVGSSNLLTRLLEYNNDGFFKFNLTDESTDEGLSSIQSITAISMYNVFKANEDQAVNIFIIK